MSIPSLSTTERESGALHTALLGRTFRVWPLMAVMSVLGPLAVASVLSGTAAEWPLLAWLLVSEGVGLAAVGLALAWPRLSARHLGIAATAISLANGLMVGALMPLFFVPDSLAAGVLPAAICAVAGSATLALHAHRPAMLALLTGSLLPLLWWAIWDAPEAKLGISALVLLYAAMLVAYGWRAHSSLRELLALRLENRRLLVESERRRQAAEAAHLAKTRFLAAASHDLRQPLSALSFQVDALAVGSEPPSRSKVERLQHSVTTLTELLDGLLDLSRLDAPGTRADVQNVDIAALLGELQAAFMPLATAKQLRWRMRVPASLMCATDPMQLSRVLQNLISNALRYTDHGGVLVAAKRRGNGIRIRVFDTGPGIAPEHQTRVFEEFFQVPPRDNNGGLGLGLALAKRIARILQGELSLRSRVGRGSCFTLELPSLPLPDRSDQALPPGNVDALQGRLVLVMEDDPETRYALHGLLDAWGCKVIAAESLDAALLAVVDTRLAPDVLISDYQLQGSANGVVAIERIRDEFNQALPAILLTAAARSDVLAEDVGNGVIALRKPASANALQRALAEVLSARPDDAH